MSELFVGNLNPDIQVRDLENVFGRYGKITRCDLKKNYAFIQLTDERDAEEAIRKENDRRLLGSVMTVEWAKGGPRGPPRGSGGPGYNRDRSPPGRYGGGGPPMRRRSPFGGGRPPMRDRSPMGRDGPPPRSNGFPPRDDRFGGRNGGRDGRGPPRGDDRFPPRDRYSGPDSRFNDRGPPPRRPSPPSDRGYRGGPPPRDNGYNDRPRRQSFGDRRDRGGPRRF